MTSTASGRPVRFFVLLMGGWATVRVAIGMLGATGPTNPPSLQTKTPVASRQATRQRIARAEGSTNATSAAMMPGPAAAPRDGGTLASPPRLPAHAIMTPIARSAIDRTQPSAPAKLGIQPVPVRPAMASAPAPRLASAAHASGPALTQDAPAAVPLAPPAQQRSDRWRGSAWLLWREGSATPANAVTAGRLGGSQAGLRLDYDLTPNAPGRMAAYGRVSTALNRPASPEAAVGLAWQPVRSVAISLAAERRIALGRGARNANAVLAVGGFGPTPVARGMEAEAYAQAGMVGFHSRDLFVDGKFSLLSPIARSPLRLGASLSGGAQPQVERLDIGPEVQIRLPLPRLATRLSVEWRERIAGHAAPSSGLAVTLGADF